MLQQKETEGGFVRQVLEKLTGEDQRIFLVSGLTAGTSRREFLSSPEGDALSLAHRMIAIAANRHGFHARLKIRNDFTEDEDFKAIPLVTYSIDLKPRNPGTGESVHSRLKKLPDELDVALDSFEMSLDHDSLYTSPSHALAMYEGAKDHLLKIKEVLMTELVEGDV